MSGIIVDIEPHVRVNLGFDTLHVFNMFILNFSFVHVDMRALG